MGGVCHPERGDNQHAQPSVVSTFSAAYVHLERESTKSAESVNTLYFVRSQGDFPWRAARPVRPLPAAPGASQRRSPSPAHALPRRLLPAS